MDLHNLWIALCKPWIRTLSEGYIAGTKEWGGGGGKQLDIAICPVK